MKGINVLKDCVRERNHAAWKRSGSKKRTMLKIKPI